MFVTQRKPAGLAALILLCVAAPLVGAEPAPGPDADAIASLRKMTDCMAALQRFSVRGHGSLEVVMTTGQKIGFDGDLALIVERPNKLRSARKGAVVDQVFTYDGKNLALHDPEHRFYAVAPAPETIDAMLDFARDELDIVAPAADLIYTNAFQLLTEDMISGFVVTRDARLQGQSCTQLAFRKPGIDIQLWISNGERPLPLKYVLTTTDVASSPQYTLTLSEWNVRPDLTAKDFEFTPPPDAKRIDFLRADASPASPR